ncbi:MAG: glycosyltransferase family 39 protein [Synechococcales bacterium]|nr:glycosyltransferase family 39 protein [Synechococcales bacterium]
MMLRKTQKWMSLGDSIWLRNLVLVLLVLGIFFRFYNLGGKVYWYDETMTSLRISGYTQAQFIADTYTGETRSVGELLAQYQYPDNGSTLEESFSALAQHPEHSPLYYLLARGWMQVLPNSVAVIRLLSATISLLALPCMFWLSMELFASPLVAWSITAFFAISPFHILYAQEAREYSLWTVTILLSSANLLWAMRWNNPWVWMTYSLTAALGLYTHPFAAFVSFSHGLYVLIVEGVRFGKRFIAYLLASLLSLLLFAPWLRVVLQNFDLFLGNTESVNADRSGSLPLFWLLNLSRIFADFNQGPSAINPLHYLLAILAIASMVFLWRRAPLESAVFLTTLMGVTGLAILAPDMLLGGRRSSITRYAVPCYLGLQMAIAYFLTSQIVSRPITVRAKTRSRKRWRAIAITLATLGTLSILVNSHIAVWWHKSYAKSRRNPDVAAFVNQMEAPLLLSDYQPAGQILSLAHLLEPTVQIQLVEANNQVSLPEVGTPLLLYLPSDRLMRFLENRQNITLEPVQFNEEEPWLWQGKQEE